MQLRVLNYSLPRCPENLAMEESLLKYADIGDSVPELTLRFWKPEYTAVILGTAQRISLDIRREHCEEDQVPIYRRSSGGGTVLHSPGVWCFSLIVPHRLLERPRAVQATFRQVLQPVLQALRAMSFPAQYFPICDLVLPISFGNSAEPPRKIAGNAQSIKKRTSLIHGSILAESDTGLIERYLAHPPSEPEYRNGRSHEDFVMTLQQFSRIQKMRWDSRNAWDVFRKNLIQEVQGAFSISETVQEENPRSAEQEIADALLENKYDNRKWIEKL